MFGSKIKEYRLNLFLSLKDFCKIIEVDTLTWSKVEREIAPPPLNIIDNIPLKFNISEIEWKLLRDEAVKDHKRIKIKQMSEQEIVNAMPMFMKFTSIKNIKDIVEIVKSTYR